MGQVCARVDLVARVVHHRSILAGVQPSKARPAEGCIDGDRAEYAQRVSKKVLNVGRAAFDK